MLCTLQKKSPLSFVLMAEMLLSIADRVTRYFYATVWLLFAFIPFCFVSCLLTILLLPFVGFLNHLFVVVVY